MQQQHFRVHQVMHFLFSFEFGHWLHDLFDGIGWISSLLKDEIPFWWSKHGHQSIRARIFFSPLARPSPGASARSSFPIFAE
jgi:hypothetical protein